MSVIKVWWIALLAAVALLAPVASQAKWLVAESPKFLVYGQGDPEGLRDYAEKLEFYDAVLRQAHGMDPLEVPPRKLPVYLVPTAYGLRQVASGLPQNVVGFYTASRGDIFAMAVRSRDPDQVVLHEYAHHFMKQYFPASYPAWLVEGYAEYYSSARITADRLSLGMPNHGRAYRILEADWLPMDQVLSGATRFRDPEDGAAFYAQSWALTHWFMSDAARREQLQHYLAMIAIGKPSVAAMTEVTGLAPEALQKTVRLYSQGQLAYTTYARTGFTVPKVTISDLPASWDDLLLPYLAMRKAMPRADGEALLAKTIRPAASKHGDDRFARLALAYGEMWFGDVKAGEALLQAMIATDPRDADALQLLGIIRVNQGDSVNSSDRTSLLKEAQGFLARSHAARGDDYRTLLYYARARRLETGYPTENTLNIITLAYDLAPQVANVRMLYAQALMRRKQWPEARIVLLPIANDPHRGQGSAQAKALLAKVETQLARPAATAEPIDLPDDEEDGTATGK